jgi:hypothetical protein
VPWVEGVRSLLHMGQAGYSSITHCILLHSTLNTTAHITDQMGPLTYDVFPVGHSYHTVDKEPAALD